MSEYSTTTRGTQGRLRRLKAEEIVLTFANEANIEIGPFWDGKVPPILVGTTAPGWSEVGLCLSAAAEHVRDTGAQEMARDMVRYAAIAVPTFTVVTGAGVALKDNASSALQRTFQLAVRVQERMGCIGACLRRAYDVGKVETNTRHLALNNPVFLAAVHNECFLRAKNRRLIERTMYVMSEYLASYHDWASA